MHENEILAELDKIEYKIEILTDTLRGQIDDLRKKIAAEIDKRCDESLCK